MKLDVFECAIFWLSKLESMDTIPIHIPQALRDTSLAKQLHQAVCAFLVVVMEVPEHARVRDVGLRVVLVRAVQGGKLDRVSDKEDR